MTTSSVSFTFDKQHLLNIEAKLNAISPKNRGGVTFKAFVRGAGEVESMLKNNLEGKILSTRTGNLRNSIGSVVTFKDGDAVGVIGSGVRSGKRVEYADIHETGGVVKPKKGKWLTIPTDAAKTKAGVQKRISARDYPNTFVRIFDRLHGAIYQKRGKRVIKLFSLVRKVVIPERRYMSQTAEEGSKRVGEIMVGMIQKELDRK